MVRLIEKIGRKERNRHFWKKESAGDKSVSAVLQGALKGWSLRVCRFGVCVLHIEASRKGV